MSHLLELCNLRTYFLGIREVVKAVDDVSLTIDPRETVGLVGESGSGKSTVAYSILRLIPPPGRVVGGDIKFQGRSLLEFDNNQMRAVRGKDISMIFQDPMSFLNPIMKISDQVAEIITAHGNVSKSELNNQVRDLLREVGIPSPETVAESYPHQLSGGMKQRAVIATALASKPALLIADEPTTALDVTVQLQILELIKELVSETGSSLLLITHDLGIVAELCNRVYVMYAGKIVEAGDVYSIYENPRHPYTQGLLKSVLSIAEFKGRINTIEGNVPNLVDPPAGCRFHPRCKFVMPRCKENEPPNVQAGGCQVACWIYP